MTHRWLPRVAAASGLVFVVLSNVGRFRGGDPNSPSLSSSGESVVRYAAGHPPGAGIPFELFALLMLVVFSMVLYARLRTAAPAIATGVLLGGLLTVGLKLASFPALLVLFGRGGETDPATAYALFAMNDYAFTFSLLGQSLMLGAVAVGGLLYGGVPRWLAASGGLIGVALFATTAASLTTDAGSFIAEVFFLLWTVVASITLMISSPAVGEVARRDGHVAAAAVATP